MVKGGVTTDYIYGADGSRLKRIDNVGTGNETTTLTFGPVEIAKFGTGADEVISTYPLPNIRLIHTKSGGVVHSDYEVLHSDQLGSLRLITDSAGARVNRRAYAPFGAILAEATWIATLPPEDRGWIGEYPKGTLQEMAQA